MMVDRLGPYELGPGGEHQGIYTGDARELALDIPDGSVDLIFTDPPYHKHNVYLFGVLANIARETLKAGGLLLTLSGQAALMQALTLLDEHLDYYWLSNMPHSLGRVGRYHPKQMMCGSKPLLWFAKGTPPPHPYIFDTFRPKVDKQYHKWGQPVGWFMYYIDKLTLPGQIVLDPFVGGGAVAVACEWLNRRYLAFEIDPDTADLARERLHQTQPPLTGLVPALEQIAMEIGA